MLTAVIPVFNEQDSLKPLWAELLPALEGAAKKWEVIFVDDGSHDASPSVLAELAAADERVTVITFRKNRGKAAALQAAFKEAKGDYVVTLDADLQDDPAEIPRLLDTLDSGFDLVTGQKKNRLDPFHKTIPSYFFNGLIRRISGLPLRDINSGFKAYKKEVVDSVTLYGELHRFIPILAANEGFKVTEIPVHHRARKYGKSKYGISRFFRGILDLLTVVFITKFLKRPLHLFGGLGLCFFTAGVLISLYMTFLHFALHQVVGERPLLLFGVLFIIAGIQLVSTGLIAELMTYYAQKNPRQ